VVSAEGVAPVLARRRSIQVHAEVVAVRDLKPEELAWVVVPPSFRNGVT
jgi:hypothetical protein